MLSMNLKINNFRNIAVSHKKMATLQIDYTSLIKVPLKFNFFVRIINENSLVVLTKLCLRHVAKEISFSNLK